MPPAAECVGTRAQHQLHMHVQALSSALQAMHSESPPPIPAHSSYKHIAGSNLACDDMAAALEWRQADCFLKPGRVVSWRCIAIMACDRRGMGPIQGGTPGPCDAVGMNVLGEMHVLGCTCQAPGMHTGRLGSRRQKSSLSASHHMRMLAHYPITCLPLGRHGGAGLSRRASTPCTCMPRMWRWVKAGHQCTYVDEPCVTPPLIIGLCHAKMVGSGSHQDQIQLLPEAGVLVNLCGALLRKLREVRIEGYVGLPDITQISALKV